MTDKIALLSNAAGFQRCLSSKLPLILWYLAIILKSRSHSNKSWSFPAVEGSKVRFSLISPIISMIWTINRLVYCSFHFKTQETEFFRVKTHFFTCKTFKMQFASLLIQYYNFYVAYSKRPILYTLIYCSCIINKNNCISDTNNSRDINNCIYDVKICISNANYLFKMQFRANFIPEI